MSLWTPQTWDWAALARTVLGAGLGSAAFQWGLTLHRDKRQRRFQASYMAMRLAVTLEFYASACSDLLSENSSAQHVPDHEYPDWDIKLPQEPSYPDDAEGWRAIDQRLAGRCLSFPNKIRQSQRIIYWDFEYDNHPYETLCEHVAARGLEAWQLAVALRRKHRVEKADTWLDYSEGLQTTLQKAEEAKKRERAAYASLP